VIREDRLDEKKTMTTNNQQAAREEAVIRAREALRGTDLARAAALGGVTLREDGAPEILLLGRVLRVVPDSLEIVADDGNPVSPVDEMLVLRYLAVTQSITPLGEDITYRELPGGQFYIGALVKRTSELVLKVFENDIDRLRKALGTYPGEDLQLGDLSKRIHAIGRIHITLIYRQGDDEFPPTLDILYDRAIARVYKSDEVAALATQLCVGLLRRGSSL
jgi:hypothetical protein